MAPLPPRRTMAPATRSGPARPRGRWHGRRLLRRPRRRTVRDARRDRFIRRSRGSGPICSRPTSTRPRRIDGSAHRSGPTMSISEALLDQRALAGIGNIWRNETLFAERVDPFAPVARSRRRDARPVDRHGPTAAHAECRSSRRDASPTKVYRTGGSAVSRDAGRRSARARSSGEIAADDVLVPELSGRYVMAAIETGCEAAPEGGWRCTVTVARPARHVDPRRDGRRRRRARLAAAIDGRRGRAAPLRDIRFPARTGAEGVRSCPHSTCPS